MKKGLGGPFGSPNGLIWATKILEKSKKSHHKIIFLSNENPIKNHPKSAGQIVSLVGVCANHF